MIAVLDELARMAIRDGMDLGDARCTPNSLFGLRETPKGGCLNTLDERVPQGNAFIAGGDPGELLSQFCSP